MTYVFFYFISNRIHKKNIHNFQSIVHSDNDKSTVIQIFPTATRVSSDDLIKK